MRTTIVPAQITTVEDKIAGRLGLMQVMLLVMPVFIGSGLFVILPPFFSYAIYKVMIIGTLALFCGLLAIRIKGKILLLWAIVLLRYNFRPRYYVYSKNTTHMRDIVSNIAVLDEMEEEPRQTVITVPQRRLSVAELVTVETLLADPTANVHFMTNKKGALSVHLTEKPQESLSTPAN